MIGLGRLAWSIENIVDSVPRRADRQIEQEEADSYNANIRFEFPLRNFYRTTPSSLMKSIRRGFSPVSWRAASASGLAGLLIGAKLAGPIGGLAGLAVGVYAGSQIKTKINYAGRLQFEIESPAPREKLKYYANFARQNKFFLPHAYFGVKWLASKIASSVAAPARPALARPDEPETYTRTISMAYGRRDNSVIVRYKAAEVPKNVLEWDTYSITAAAENKRRLDSFTGWLINVPRRIREALARPAGA